MTAKTLTSEQIAHVRQAIAAKCQFWDAMRALELATVSPGEQEWSDHQSDKVNSFIDVMAAGTDANISDSSLVSDDEIQICAKGLFA